MNALFRLFLTFLSTAWMIIIYAVKERWTIFSFPYWMLGLIMIGIIVVFSVISLNMCKQFGKEKLESEEMASVDLVDKDFLPVYLGYFFVSLSVGKNAIGLFIFVYSTVLFFTFLSQTQIFNPVYLLLGYHFYKVETVHGTKLFVAYKGSVIRNIKEVSFENLRRINDVTYIEKR